MNGHQHHGPAAAAPMDIYHDHHYRQEDAGGLAGRVSRFFRIEERGSTIGTEIRAGVVTFLTMSYILLVNPQILSQVSQAGSQISRSVGLVSGRGSNLDPFGLRTRTACRRRLLSASPRPPTPRRPP